jgi:hypothetical protein
LLTYVKVIAGAQINNKVFWETHLFSTYPFNGASQPLISYDYMQDESGQAICKMKSESLYICAGCNKTFRKAINNCICLQLAAYSLQLFLIYFLHIFSEKLLGWLSGYFFEYPVKGNGVVKPALVGNSSKAVEILRYNFLAGFVNANLV